MMREITATAPPGRLGLCVEDDKTEPNFNTIITKVSEQNSITLKRVQTNH
jgi:hypothetical protein